LLDTFVLSPAAALSLAPDGNAAAGAAAVTLPFTVFPAVDEAMPGTARIFRNVPSGISIFTWPDLMLQALKSLSGPEIVSIIVASAGLVGLGQVWRRRRREP
jgi:hypothetical protein